MEKQQGVAQFVLQKNAQLTPETDCEEMLNQVKEKMISVQPAKYTDILNSFVTMLISSKINRELKDLLDNSLNKRQLSDEGAQLLK